MTNFATLLRYLPKKIQLMKGSKPNVKGMKKIILDPKYTETPFPQKKMVQRLTLCWIKLHNCIFLFRFTGSTLLTLLMRDGWCKVEDEDERVPLKYFLIVMIIIIYYNF